MRRPRHLGRKLTLLVGVLCVAGVAAAAADPAAGGAGGAAAGCDSKVGFEAISCRVTGQVSSFTKLLITIAYVAGVGFGIGAVFKFKQHKDNPTQVPIGTPFAMFTVAVLLVFLPALFAPAKETVFGDKATGLSGPMIT